jgi:hypothetical protein
MMMLLCVTEPVTVHIPGESPCGMVAAVVQHMEKVYYYVD